ncbi:MAG: tyrosine-type recombinase/integrase [Candidatus Omnitrophica bacterium]|nr:tyrosine-type recombinase/integrase [Candidatus Omnitrophota bacterium]
MGIYRRGENWWIDFYARGNRVREKIGPIKKLAENALAKRRTEVIENKYFDIDNIPRIRLKEFAGTFLNSYCKPNKISWFNDDTYLRQILEFFGDVYLDEITPVMIENLKAHRLSQGAKQATVNRVLACLRTMLNKAIEWGKLKDTPMKKIKLFKEDNMRTRFLAKEEFERLLDNCPPHLRNIVICAVNTGMRRNEMLHLKWSDVDFMNKIINVKKTKAKKQRAISINSVLERLLINIRERSTSEYVFCYNNRKIDSVKTAFNSALKKAEINDFRFHDLRHTAGTYLRQSGADLITIKEILGHSKIEMTARYAHSPQDAKAKALEALGRELVVTPQSQTNIDENSKVLYLSQVIENKELENSVSKA